MTDFPKHLEELVSQMDVPSYRIHDAIWLAKNLEYRNKNHRNFKETMKILKELVKPTIKKKDFERIFGNE